MTRFGVWIRTPKGKRRIKPSWARRVRGWVAYSRAKALEDRLAARYGGDNVKVRERPQVDTREWVVGDVEIPAGTPLAAQANWRRLRAKLVQAAQMRGRVLKVNDGLRPYPDQVRAWEAYKAGTGPLAAYPGTSNHGRGLAADCVDAETGQNVWNDREWRGALAKAGLHCPIPTEPWHVTEQNVWG